jgi:hypothetical protein
MVTRPIQVIDHQQIEELATQAAASPRKRAHFATRQPVGFDPAAFDCASAKELCTTHHHSRQWEMLSS